MALARQDPAHGDLRAARGPRTPFDYAHTNSVNLDTDGDFLMSARNTWAVYKIDRETGRIRWRLGGKKSTFRLPRAARFAWQHDVHRRATARSRVFDNSAFPPVRKFSRALALRLDEAQEDGVADLRGRASRRKLLTATQGNQQTLPNGSFLVGWGSQRQLTEYDSGGNVLFNAALSLGFESLPRATACRGSGCRARAPRSPRRTSRAPAPTST